MKWWQQLIVQVGCILCQGFASHYLPNDLKDTIIVAIATVQAAIAHKGAVSDPITGENIKKGKDTNVPNT